MTKLLEEIKQGHRIIFVRNDEVLGRRDCTIEVDDPGLDSTDAAHPAYFRGQDQAVNHLVVRLNKVLDGGDNGAGGFSHQGLQALRVKLLELVKNRT